MNVEPSRIRKVKMNLARISRGLSATETLQTLAWALPTSTVDLWELANRAEKELFDELQQIAHQQGRE
jgi:hypothetical protein